MKRAFKLFIVATLLMVGFGFVAPPKAEAALNAKQCQDKFGYSKEFGDLIVVDDRAEGLNQRADLLNGNYVNKQRDIKRGDSKLCFDTVDGSCLTKIMDDRSTGSRKEYRIKCSGVAGSNQDAYGVDDDGVAYQGSDSDVITDPALTQKTDCNRQSCPLIAKYINPFISLLAVLVGIAVVIGIIWGGIQISTSAGNPQQAASGKDHIRNAIIALIAFVLLYSFIQWLLPGGFI